MAIVKMKKFTLLTFATYKNELLKELQKFEDVHFKNLQRDELAELEFLNTDISVDSINHDEAELEKIKFAMDKIAPYVSKPKGVKAMTAPLEELEFDRFDTYLDTYDYGQVVDSLKAEDEKIISIKSEVTKRRSENEAMRTWLKLDISLSELEHMKYVKYLIGTVSKVAAESFRSNVATSYPAAYVEFLGDIKDDVAALIIMPSEEYEEAFTSFKTLGFSKITLNFKGIPAEVIHANNDEIMKLHGLQDDAMNRIKESAGEYDKLRIVFDYYQTVLERERACQNFLKMETVFLIEGWVPEEDSNKLKEIVTKICGDDCYLEEDEVPQDSVDVPIKLKNNGLVSSFESLTAMFSMPKYNEMDPTPLLTPFYLVFFGFMVGDAGYGLIMLIATMIALKSFALKESARRFMKFFFYLSFSTIFAGIVYGSFFGITFFAPITTADGAIQLASWKQWFPFLPGVDGSSTKAIIDTQTDVILMLVASVALGFVHILAGLVAKGYMLLRDGKILDAIFDSLFFIITLLACLGLVLGVVGIGPANLFTISALTGIVCLVGLAVTQGRENETLVGKIAGGLYAVYGLTGYVGDFVSYTRIAALALSGAYIAFSFNLMGGLFPSGPVRFIAGGIVVVIGQAIGFGLGALGAYVHTCRLQYVEFFGKFYEGGGVPFEAFKLKNKYINIKK